MTTLCFALLIHDQQSRPQKAARVTRSVGYIVYAERGAEGRILIISSRPRTFFLALYGSVELLVGKLIIFMLKSARFSV